MLKYDYISLEHKIIIDRFLESCIDIVHTHSDSRSFAEWFDVLEIICAYHNEYNNDTQKGHLRDYLSIIPINTMTATQGYLAGRMSDNNFKDLRDEKQRLTDIGFHCVDSISKLKLEDE